MRKRGPNAGRVEVVPFWNYVGTVLAAEYSKTGNKGPIWQRMGAQAVKQYAWYYTMNWRGGKVTVTNEDGSTFTECFDVRDSTADQIYAPEKLVNGQWVPINVPSQANLSAMAEIWPNSLRKWVVKKQKSRLFLTGYRSGKKQPCGADADGFRVKQKSMGDCIVKGLTYEETMREYYEPNFLMVDPRERDILDDSNTYFGDFGLLNPGSGGKTGWRVYAGQDQGFAAPVTGTFDITYNNVTDQGMGDVTGDSRNDLVMLVSGKLRLAVANGTGYDAPGSAQDLPGGAWERMLVGDFNGDLLADVGLLRSTLTPPLPNETATMVVMRGNANGNFSAAVDWWRGILDLSLQQVATGDVNGDGKSDLVIADATSGVTFSVAPSFASCLDLSVWGACPSPGGTGLDIAAPWLNKSGWSLSNVKWSMTDFNRDGRSDVVAVVKDGTGVDVLGAKAQLGGGFADSTMMLDLDSVAFADVIAIGSDVNPDGLGDLVLLKKNSGSTTVQWLRAEQAFKSSAVTYVAAGSYNDIGLTWAPTSIRAY